MFLLVPESTRDLGKELQERRLRKCPSVAVTDSKSSCSPLPNWKLSLSRSAEKQVSAVESQLLSQYKKEAPEQIFGSFPPGSAH